MFQNNKTALNFRIKLRRVYFLISISLYFYKISSSQNTLMAGDLVPDKTLVGVNIKRAHVSRQGIHRYWALGEYRVQLRRGNCSSALIGVCKPALVVCLSSFSKIFSSRLFRNNVIYMTERSVNHPGLISRSIRNL